MKIFELDIWKGDWGLPSVDLECLQVLTYAKFSDIPLKVNASNNPFRTRNSRLPVLRACHDELILDSAKSIIEYFRGKNYNVDYGLSQKICADVIAYDKLLREKLYPALQFVWWIDKKNVDELVRPWYCKALPFPFNFYYPGKYEQTARTMFETLFPGEDNMTVIESKVYAEAQKCLTLLSRRLEDSLYFFGEKPTTLDAIIYSYLAPLLKAPLPNPALQNHLKACTNLVKYVSRISLKYFKNEYNDYEQQRTEEDIQKIRRNSETEFPHKRRNQFLAGLFAGLAMAGYALSNGIVKSF
ncbi:metaxin-1 [Calliopsis andreniformis]|uniref:metaxin-1 n=1 Tax=Calliopsis andreniformis TaxID=337506 RepID=UPI003FCD5CEF